MFYPSRAVVVGAGLLSFLLIVLNTIPSYSLNPLLGRRYFSPGTETGDFFGWPIAGNESTIFIGSIFDSHGNGAMAGSVRVMRKDGEGWTFDQEILPPPGSEQAQFGFVAYDTDTLVVGAPTAKNSRGIRTGCVYLYTPHNNQWVHTATLNPDPDTEHLRYGYRVAIHDPYIVVAAVPQSAEQIPFITVYKRQGQTWNVQARFTARYPGRYGESIAIGGNRILVGAPDSSIQGKRKGLVHIYQEENGNWNEQESLIPGDTPSMESFGEAVALNSKFIAVGAPLANYENDPSHPRLGVVIMYAPQGNLWVETTRLIPSLRHMIRFGASLAIQEDSLLVGATHWLFAQEYLNRRLAPARVFVYRCVGNQWHAVDHLFPERDDAIGFAQSLFLRGNKAWIGAPLARDDDGYPRGCVYEFDLLLETPSAQPIPAPVYTRTGPLQLVQAIQKETPYEKSFSGYSLALDNGTLAVAERYFPPERANSYKTFEEAVHIYKQDGRKWVKAQTLSSPEEDYEFGTSIALKRDRMLLGPRGLMYEKEGDSWKFVSDLPKDHFPKWAAFETFDVDNDLAVLGFTGDGYNLFERGSICTFQRTDGHWHLQDTIRTDPPIGWGIQGRKLAINGPLIIVDTLDPGGYLLTRCLLFQYRNRKWMQNDTTSEIDSLGRSEHNSVVQGHSLLIAKWPFFPPEKPSDPGEAYYYKWKNTGYLLKQKIVEPDLPPYHEFGTAMALDGTRLAVGAPRMKAVFFYDLVGDKWIRSQRLDLNQVVANEEEYSIFGSTIDMEENTVVIGASSHNGSVKLDEVFIFEIHSPNAPLPTATPVKSDNGT